MQAGPGSSHRHAARTPGAQTLDVWLDEAGAKVNPNGSISVTGGYDCEGEAGAQLRVDFTADNGSEGTTDMSGPCLRDGTFTAIANPDAGSARFSRTVSAEAHALLTAGSAEANDEAVVVGDTAFLETDAGATRNADGSITVSGTYGCADTFADAEVNVTVHDRGATADRAGTALLRLPCPATNKTWTTTIRPTVTIAPKGVPAFEALAADARAAYEGCQVGGGCRAGGRAANDQIVRNLTDESFTFFAG